MQFAFRENESALSPQCGMSVHNSPGFYAHVAKQIRLKWAQKRYYIRPSKSAGAPPHTKIILIIKLFWVPSLLHFSLVWSRGWIYCCHSQSSRLQKSYPRPARPVRRQLRVRPRCDWLPLGRGWLPHPAECALLMDAQLGYSTGETRARGRSARSVHACHL